MLLITGVEVDVVAEGTRQMLVLQPPCNPGVVYRIEMEGSTASRIRGILQVEIRRMAAQAVMEPDEEGPPHDPFNRA